MMDLRRHGVVEALRQVLSGQYTQMNPLGRRTAEAISRPDAEQIRESG